jgi:hypothetical protein
VDTRLSEEHVDPFAIGGGGVASVAMLCKHTEVLVLWKCGRNGSIPKDFSRSFVEANEVAF